MKNLMRTTLLTLLTTSALGYFPLRAEEKFNFLEPVAREQKKTSYYHNFEKNVSQQNWEGACSNLTEIFSALPSSRRQQYEHQALTDLADTVLQSITTNPRHHAQQYLYPVQKVLDSAIITAKTQGESETQAKLFTLNYWVNKADEKVRKRYKTSLEDGRIMLNHAEHLLKCIEFNSSSSELEAVRTSGAAEGIQTVYAKLLLGEVSLDACIGNMQKLQEVITISPHLTSHVLRIFEDQIEDYTAKLVVSLEQNNKTDKNAYLEKEVDALGFVLQATGKENNSKNQYARIAPLFEGRVEEFYAKAETERTAANAQGYLNQAYQMISILATIDTANQPRWENLRQIIMYKRELTTILSHYEGMLSQPITEKSMQEELWSQYKATKQTYDALTMEGFGRKSK